MYSDFIIIFILGTIVGSFINVVVYRHNTGRSFVSGRSMCMHCSKKLEWYELVPLFSFIFLKGKCFNCKSKLSYQYPIVELLTGIIFVMTLYFFGLTLISLYYLIVFSILVTISVYDFKHKIIPNDMVFTFDIAALVILFLTHKFYGPFLSLTLWDLAAGPILFAFFGGLWLVSRGKWMGFGDAKLALGVGWLLGFYGGIFAIMMAFWIGAVFSIILLILQKLNLSKFGLTIKSVIPFAPFIILALFIQIITSWSLLTLLA